MSILSSPSLKCIELLVLYISKGYAKLVLNQLPKIEFVQIRIWMFGASSEKED